MGNNKIGRIRDPYLREKMRQTSWLGITRAAWQSRLGLPAFRYGKRENEARLKALDRLRQLGVRSLFAGRTLFTGTLSAGCRACLEGANANYCVTFSCNRDCFFCYQPRRGRGLAYSPVIDPKSLLEKKELKSFSISGGEPLLEPEKTIDILRQVKARFPRCHVHLYTNGSLAATRLLKELASAGLDEIRFNLWPDGYRTTRLEQALGIIPEVRVEIPVIPADEKKAARLLMRLNRLGVQGVNLHEFQYFGYNREAYDKLGCGIIDRGVLPSYTEAAVCVRGSEEAAFRLLTLAVEKRLRLPVHYCSGAAKREVQHRRKRVAACLENRLAHEKVTRDGLLERLVIGKEGRSRALAALRGAGVAADRVIVKNGRVETHPDNLVFLEQGGYEMALVRALPDHRDVESEAV